MTTAKSEKDKRTEAFLLAPSLGYVLERLIDAINLSASKQHEIVEGLAYHGITTWQSFIFMDEDDVKTLTREGRQHQMQHQQQQQHVMVPLSPTSVRLLQYLKQLVMDNIEKDLLDAELPTTYTKKMYTKYVLQIKLEKRRNTNAHRKAVVDSNTDSPALAPAPAKILTPKISTTAKITTAKTPSTAATPATSSPAAAASTSANSAVDSAESAAAQAQAPAKLQGTLTTYYAKNAIHCNAKSKEYYAKNREKIIPKRKEYYKKNQEKLRKKKREYYAKNREKLREKKREYRAKNHEKLKIKKREYDAKNRQEIKSPEFGDVQ